jgi:hypothetical protein
MLKFKILTEKARKILESNMDPIIDKYAKALENDFEGIVSSDQNKKALVLMAKEFAEVLRANPSLMNESAKIINEMSKYEATETFDKFADIMDNNFRNVVGGKVGDNKVASIITDNIVDIAQNIKQYPSLLASITLTLKDEYFYKYV